jgi:hypothetical protein
MYVQIVYELLPVIQQLQKCFRRDEYLRSCRTDVFQYRENEHRHINSKFRQNTGSPERNGGVSRSDIQEIEVTKLNNRSCSYDLP